MSIPGKALLISMGIFLGVILFGINVSLTHFNRLVEPEQPLHLLEWHVEKNNLEISLLGETRHVSLNADEVKEWSRLIGATCRNGREELAALLRRLHRRAGEVYNRWLRTGKPGVL